MKKYLVEFIGTFFLVLTIGMTVIDPGAGNLAPLAIGSALMIMIYAGGHVSGAHYNPAVTLAVWLRGRCATADVPFYFIAQVLGATAAAFVVLYLKGNPGRGTPDMQVAVVRARLRNSSAHLRPRVCRAECRHGQSHGGQFQLRPRHRLHRDGDGLRIERHFRRRVQSGGRHRRHDHASWSTRRTSGFIWLLTSLPARSPR